MKKLILTTILILCTTLFSFGQNSVMDFYEAEVKALKNEYESDYGSPLPAGIEKEIIKVKDVQNGYVSYGFQGFWTMGYKEMAYFISNGGKKFVAVATFGCGPACNTSEFKFYELQNGKLVDKTTTYYPSQLKMQVENLLPNPDFFWVKVPRYGTNIQIGYPNPDATFDESEVIFVCELQFNIADGIFTFVAK